MNKETGRRDPLVMTWPYLPESGSEPLGYVARYQWEGGKNVVPFFVADERFQFKAGAAPAPRPLFGLDTLSRHGPVFVAEGEKPAAALHFLGFAAVTSPGGSQAASQADWEPLKRIAADPNRGVWVWPDNDAPGRAYAAAVARLVGEGCECLLSPPAGTPDEKGADAADWLTAQLAELGIEWDGLHDPSLSEEDGRTIRFRLLGAVGRIRGKPPAEWGGHNGTDHRAANGHAGAAREMDNEPRRYVALDRGIMRIDGDKEFQLCNFKAVITDEVKRDDGQDTALALTVAGAMEGRTLPAVSLTFEQFERMSWPAKCWGTACLVHPGQGAKEHLRHAIQYLSHRGEAPVRVRTVYTHTGWRQVNGEWAFLSAGAVIGAGAQVSGVEVDLGELGELYRLPPPSRTQDERRAAAVASMEAATIAPPEASIPLIACAYLAPLAQALSVDFALWLEGPSRSYKSTLAAIMAAHFGPGFEHTSLPSSWNDTQNSIGYKLFVLADTLVVVDDYAPQPTAGDQAKLDKAVNTVIRSIGNRSGRGRLTADIRLQNERRPRALTLCTAEQWPHGESINARLFGVSLSPGMVDKVLLDRGQEAARSGTLARAMSDHLATVAGDFDRYTSKAREDWKRLRDEAMGANLSGRAPAQAAFLLVGYSQALRHWQTAGAIGEAAAVAMFADARRIVWQLARTHERRIASAQPADAFVTILTDLLLSGGAYLLDMNNKRPDLYADRYGWKKDVSDGPHIGWVNEPKREIYLLPDAALEAVTTRARRIDSPLNIRPAALWRQLMDRGLLLDGGPEDREGGTVRRTTRKVRIGDNRPRVLVLPLSILGENEQE
jgi:hypothetical protein